jgi:hypothetical protein
MNGSHNEYFAVILNWLEKEQLKNESNNSTITNNKKFRKEEWTVCKEHIQQNTQQTNGYDCGMFVIMFMYCLANNLDINSTIKAKDMPLYRNIIAIAILNGEI